MGCQGSAISTRAVRPHPGPRARVMVSRRARSAHRAFAPVRRTVVSPISRNARAPPFLGASGGEASVDEANRAAERRGLKAARKQRRTTLIHQRGE
jgi:hypothetical protein